MNIADWRPSDVSSMTGKRVLITGASDGLGYQTALVLARAGAEIIMPARTATKGEDAARRIRQAVPKAIVETGFMDLTNLASVREFAEAQLRRGETIDILINNAGVMAIPKRTLSRDGYEMQFATNVLGPFLLTGLLLPLILAGESPRIVTLSSGAQKLAKPLQLDNLNSEKSYDAMMTYAQTKMENVLVGREIQRRAGTRLASIICQPGVAKTNLLSGPQPFYFKTIMSVLRPFLKSAEVACWSTLFAATSPIAEPGHYYGPKSTLGKGGNLSESQMCEPAKDGDAGIKLFDKLEAMVGAKYKFN
jgi:NAD(P)-dependent dehydrogenase (short-subunit alcohol dehydrogenase family)